MRDSPYTIRLPANLRKLLMLKADEVKGSVASVIIAACWAYLDEKKSVQFGVPKSAYKDEPLPAFDGREVKFFRHDLPTPKGVAIGVPLPPMNDAMAKFMSAAKVVIETPKVLEIPLCHKDWWEDGVHFDCLMDAGHREQKHGMRGLVRRLDD